MGREGVPGPGEGHKDHLIIDRQPLPLRGGEQGWGKDNAAVGGRQLRWFWDILDGFIHPSAWKLRCFGDPLSGFIHPSAWKTRGEEVGASSSPIGLSSCCENPFFPAFCSSQSPSWCSALSTTQRGLLGIQSPGRKSPLLIPIPVSRDLLPPSQCPPFAPFLGFHPKPAGFTPQLWLCVRAELGGVWDHPDPARSGERGPRPAAGAAGPPAAPAWVEKARFGGFGSFSCSVPDKSPAGLQHPRCWGGSESIPGSGGVL